MSDTTVTDRAGETTVAVLVGSLRAGSLNRRIAETAVENVPTGVTAALVDGLADVPFYNPDIDVAPLPPAAAELRARVGAADAVLIVTPEYNGTIPAVLKNAIDWVSRPYGAGSLQGKPVAVVGAALGRYGGKWSHDDTRRSVGVAGGVAVADVEVSLAASAIENEDPAADGSVVAALRGALERLRDADVAEAA